MYILKIIINILIVGLFLFSKLLIHKDKLNPQYKGVFYFFESIFNPLLNGFKKIIKPFQVGQGLFIDMTQIVLLILLLVLNRFL